MPAQGLGVALDPDRGRLGGAQRVDPEQERQRPWWTLMVGAPGGTGSARAGPGPGSGSRHGGPSEAARTRPGRPGSVRRCGRTGRTRARRASSWSPTRPVARSHRGGGCRARRGRADPHQRVESVAVAPTEPAAQLVGVQAVGVPRVAGQKRNRRELGGTHRIGLEREHRGRGHDPSPGEDVSASPRLATRTVRHPRATPLLSCDSQPRATSHSLGRLSG